jgi:hypothetical protein
MVKFQSGLMLIFDYVEDAFYPQCYLTAILMIWLYSLRIELEEGKLVSILLYDDDVVVLAKSEQDLHAKLDNAFIWCNTNQMTISVKKSNMVLIDTKNIVSIQVWNWYFNYH